MYASNMLLEYMTLHGFVNLLPGSAPETTSNLQNTDAESSGHLMVAVWPDGFRAELATLTVANYEAGQDGESKGCNKRRRCTAFVIETKKGTSNKVMGKAVLCYTEVTLTTRIMKLVSLSLSQKLCYNEMILTSLIMEIVSHESFLSWILKLCYTAVILTTLIMELVSLNQHLA